MLIYKWTSPSGKQYIGKTIYSLQEKYKWYNRKAKVDNSNRLIFNAIRKYGIENMKLEKIEENLNWSHEELNQKEIYYISYYNSYFKNRLGYNMTRGGDGLDPETAKTMMIEWHTNASKQQKFSRSINCSIGQQTRYKNSSDSLETIEKKRKSHQGHYIIISPDGERYKATEGLKEFAETYREKLNISYWQLFNAYRKTYSNQLTKQHRKNLNKWKVCRIDK